MDLTRRNFIKDSFITATGLSTGIISIPQMSFAQNTNNLVLIKGGSFTMGSVNSEFLRESDEIAHNVEVSDFYISKYPVTQKEYLSIIGNNPSRFHGDNKPVENVTWFDAINYCNALSIKHKLTPVYEISDNKVLWNMNADGYRLPTEAEWEYAARAGSNTPFYTGSTITVKDANYYGTYPYYYDEKSGKYIQETVNVGSYPANSYGLYDMSGNVWQWCWDWYGKYNSSDINNPVGAEYGCYKVHRGGGWNDFARHLRSAYRAATVPYNKLYNIGFRIARSTKLYNKTVTSSSFTSTYNKKGSNLIVYFSWSGNTERLAKNIHNMVNSDIIKLEMLSPYSNNYSTCLTQSRKDQEQNIHPAIKNIKIDEYSNIFLGYPTWWATMPMPMWTFLEQHNFKNKRIIPFASHGEGRLAQTISAIAKTVPETAVGEAFSIMYSDLSKKQLEQWISKIID